MENGLIYSIFNWLFQRLKYLNLVELFKFCVVKINPQEKVTFERVGADIFIFIKWVFLFTIWHFGISNPFITFCVWYLIAANIYTYFIYHIWDDNAIDTSGHDYHRIRRRFLNLLLAVAFSDISFAYLYRYPYLSDFTATSEGNYIWFSISNSLAANYSVIQPLSNTGNNVAMIQLILTFIFITIIISRSIPQKN